jgi:hypothetical protein
VVRRTHEASPIEILDRTHRRESPTVSGRAVVATVVVVLVASLVMVRAGSDRQGHDLAPPPQPRPALPPAAPPWVAASEAATDEEALPGPDWSVAWLYSSPFGGRSLLVTVTTSPGSDAAPTNTIVRGRPATMRAGPDFNLAALQWREASFGLELIGQNLSVPELEEIAQSIEMVWTGVTSAPIPTPRFVPEDLEQLAVQSGRAPSAADGAPHAITVNEQPAVRAADLRFLFGRLGGTDTPVVLLLPPLDEGDPAMKRVVWDGPGGETFSFDT